MNDLFVKQTDTVQTTEII